MIILRNDVLRFRGEDGHRLRVLWVNPGAGCSFALDLDGEGSTPEPLDLPSVVAQLEEGQIEIVADYPKAVVTLDEQLPISMRERRDKAWNAIAPLVQDEPNIYIPNRRGPAIIARAIETGITFKTLYKYLRRYWERGQTPNALLPDYANSGAKGKSRVGSRSLVKRGRPRCYGSQPGVNVDEDMLRIFRIAITRYAATTGVLTLVGAYEQMIKDFFCEKKVDPKTNEFKHSLGQFATTGQPSFGQFDYWYRKNHDEFVIKRRRVGSKIYDKDMRGLLGTSSAEVWGPGARYQIDATIADVYLVSRLDRNRIIGRPILYVVIDVFSRMIVGIYVGLEGPSWVGAMMAIANTASDKVAYCARFGKVIEQEDWPCHHLPSILLGDRGEIESRYINALSQNFGIVIENAAAYRADWKGIVEQRFRLLPAKFKAYVAGYIQPDFRERGAHDYRLDAVLDLDQFTAVIIECVLFYNNTHDIQGYDRSREVAEDLVRTVPLDLWNWGIANVSGKLKAYPEDLVQIALMPSDEATVTTHGIRYQGMHYSCPLAIKEHWFERARQRGTWKVNISYDPRAMDRLYLLEGATTYQVCELTERSRADKGLSLWEIGQQQCLEKHQHADHRPKRHLGNADTLSNIDRVVAEAKAMKPETRQSARQRTQSVKENRAQEKAHNRKSEVMRPGLSPSSETVAEVIPIKPTVTPSYQPLSMDEMLKSLDEDEPS